MKRLVKQAKWEPFKCILLGMVMLSGLITFSKSYSHPSKISNHTSNTQSPVALKDSVDKKTGLIIAPGFNLVSTTCVRCHSPKLISEKRATREGWLATIRWMQQTQGLWDLGPQEPAILDYLAKNYAPKNEGRRPPLRITEWSELNK